MNLLTKVRGSTKRLIAKISAVALVAALVSAGGGTAFAGGGTTPAWEPDPGSAAPYGNLVFYDTNGNVVTSGTNLDHLFDYAAATTGPDSGATKATLFLAAPNHALPTSGWATSQQSNSNTFPNSSAPAPLTGPGFTNPVDTLASTNANLNAAIGGFTLDTTTGYANVIQVRMKDSGAGGVGSGSHYWSTDIVYNPSTASGSVTVDGVTVAPGAWSQLYPDYTTTTVALAAVPPSPQTVTGCGSGGQNTTLTATITPTGPTASPGGTVSFFDGTTLIGTSTVTANSASTTWNAPAIGGHPLTAQFIPTGGTEVVGSTSPTQTYTVNPSTSGPTTSTTLMASPNANVKFGTPVALTANVTSSDSMAAGVTGSVQFFLNGTTSLGSSNTTVSGTPPTGTATLTTTPTQLPVGTDNLTATFTPTNSCYAPSTSTPATPVTVVAATTTTAVASSLPTGSVTGQTVTFTATVTPSPAAAGTPTGTVQFKDGTASICTPMTLDASGMASCNEQPSTAGSHIITASYTPANGNFSSSDNTTSLLSQAVSADPTTTTLMSDNNPANIPPPATVNYTATVTANAPGSGTPAGTIDFKDNGSAITGCTGLTLVSGSVTCPAQSYGTVGTYPITAVYNNTDGNYQTSTSGTLSEQVVTATTTSVATPSGSIVNGAPATFTATVTPHPDTGPGTGTVDFYDGTTKFCSAASVDSSGNATCTANLFGAGDHSITATYSGDALYGTSNSNASPVTQTVTADGVTVTLSSSAPNGLPAGQKVSYTATVTPDPPGTGTPQEGYVQFQDNGTDIPGCTQVTLSGGNAVCDPVYNSPGSHSISAIYHDPAGNYVGSASAPGALTQTVTPALGYWMVGSDGGVFTFNVSGGFFGSLGGHHLNAPIVGMALTQSHSGYWLAGSDGGVFTFGDAAFYGSLGAVHLNAPVVGIVATPTGNGYWLLAKDGGVFTFGDAVFYGSLGATSLNAAVVGMAASPTGHGYWIVGADGGVFTFGDATFDGSMGAAHLNAPVVGIVATSTGNGYWLVARDGGIFTFGDAGYYGSMGAVHLNGPIVGMAATQSGSGYRLFSGDGGVFDFGDATYQGSLPGGGISVKDIVGGTS